jgi:hypothetical protein
MLRVRIHIEICLFDIPQAYFDSPDCLSWIHNHIDKPGHIASASKDYGLHHLESIYYINFHQKNNNLIELLYLLSRTNKSCTQD